ncbi:hypothetical protein ACFSUS_04875 [Spirosoma soli]|uniref:DoxX family protein n=1 Tax=Spirosoma soli TaxID=1770529 RepID=A0ABW5M089_9BACT
MIKPASTSTIRLFGLLTAATLYYYKNSLADYIVQELSISSMFIADLTLLTIVLVIVLILKVSLQINLLSFLPLGYLMAIYFSFVYLPDYVWIPLMAVVLIIIWYFLSYRPYKEAMQEEETD